MLIETGSEARIDVSLGNGGAPIVEDLKEALFPTYSARSRAQIKMYVSSSVTENADTEVANNDSEPWQEIKPRDVLRDDEALRYGYVDLNAPEQQQQLQQHDPRVMEPPTKKQKLRDAQNDAKVEAHKCTNLNVFGFTVLPPTKSRVVRYYGREDMQEIFATLVDSHNGKVNYNLELIGAPGAGKSNLVWAAAEHLGTETTGDNVLWASRRYKGEKWNVIQFLEGAVYEYSDLPKTLDEILKLKDFSETTVLILDSPLSISDMTDTDNVHAAYAWTGRTGVRDGRIGSRRVIHVSSLGASTQKAEERNQVNLYDVSVRPWTRQDFIKAVADPQLKQKVCDTIDIEDPLSISAEQLVDRKFYFSGINARWFFDYSIPMIKKQCAEITDRMSSSTLSHGDKHREAVNSALQKYWLNGRQISLFTSTYLAKTIGTSSQNDGRNAFLVHYRLIEDYLGNGAPGEIFEANFCIHLHHCHDLAAAQQAVMDDRAQKVDVSLGTLEDGQMVLWPTGKLYKLPSVSTTGVGYQTLPDEAKPETERVAMWFIPENKSQPFLDFFVLVPNGNKWEFRAIQSTVAGKHSADVEQLKRIVGGIVDRGFDLCDKIVVAYVIEDRGRQRNVGFSDNFTFSLQRTARLRSQDKKEESQPYTVEALHIEFPRTGDVPR